MKRILLLLLAIALVVSCSGKSADPVARQVNLYVWSNYIPDRVLKDFERSTGIHLNFDTFESNEALLDKLQSGLADYDVIVPSDYMVGILRRQKMLQDLDLTRIPNVRNIATHFLNPPYDPGNMYSVPFLWSTTGIGYNTRKVSDPVDSWGILWNPKYAGRLLMLDDMRECFAVALKWKGHSLNSTNPADLQQARDLLMQQKPLLKAYDSSNFDGILLAGDVWITHGWSGNIALVTLQNPDLAYVVPKEGGPMAVENFAIPRAARHKDEAYVLINWMLDAKVGADCTNLSKYPNTNEAARAYIRPEILNNRVIYPDQATLARCELIQDIGPVYAVLDRYWTEIKSQ